MAKQTKIGKDLGIALGFEDDDSVIAGEEGEGLNGSETVEGEMLEVADADAEVTEAATDVEATEDSIENLEEIQVALESAAANGGLTRESAVFANIALRGALGKKAARVIMPAMPSFESYTGGTSSRRATTLSLEIVGETLRKFWAALVAKMKAMWNKLRGWWKKMTDAAPKIKARAEALAKKSADITGQAEERTLELALSSQLHIDGRTPQPATVVAQLKNLDKGCDVFLGGESKGSMEKIAKDFEGTIQGFEDNTDFKNLNGKGLSGVYQQLGGKGKTVYDSLIKSTTAIGPKISALGSGGGTTADLEKRFGADGAHVISAQLMGGRAVVGSSPKSSFGITNPEFTYQRLVRSAGLRFTDFLAKPKEIDGTGEFKTLSSSDIRSICDNIADVMDKIMEYSKNWQAREKMQADIESSGTKAINSADKDSGQDDATNAQGAATENLGLRAKVVKDIVGAAMAWLRIGTSFESSYINYCTKVSQALLQWAERSIAQYK